MELVDYGAIQRRLLKLGFNPGPVDGVLGRNTLNAIKLFQESRGLVADGLVGPATFAALFGKPLPGEAPAYDRAPWFQEAIRLAGLREVPGPESNQSLMEMAEDLDIDYSGDDVPWCGLYVAHCISCTLPSEALPTVPLRARAWERFGLDCQPELGAMLVFWREPKSSGNGHVGFYFGEDATHYHVIGGNQSDAVNVRRVARKRYLTSRWPSTALGPTGITRLASASGLESTSEA